jgi:hypothetical protein
MKIFLSACAAVFILTSYACHDEIKFSLIGCCETQITGGPVGNSKIFIPNVFTPNGDGVNERFYVFGDSIRRIINFEIRDKLNKTVYKVVDINYPGFENAWDGKVNGVVEKGLYSIFVTIETNDGIIGSFEGKICNFPCNLEGEDDKISPENCHFPSEWGCWLYDDGCLILENPDCFE